MSDIFGSYLEKDHEIQNALSMPRLILAAVAQARGRQQHATELMDLVGVSASDFQRALQLLADEGLVTARPTKSGLMVMATSQGQRLAGS
jgi:DNA-binding IclR family transcriptional regulator